MEREKVKDIKETIQETIDGKLSNKYLTICEISCCPRLDIDKLFPDILTLINELESENEKLSSDNKRLSEENFVLYRDRFTKKELDDISAFRVTKATEELKDRIVELEKENAKLKGE